MPSVINTNVMSLNARRNMLKSSGDMANAMQRLSTGLRINSAKDDAAGLAISQRMTGQIRGMSQAVRNTNDGISMVQTTEGALQTVSDNLQRVRELAVESTNNSNTPADRIALNAEAQSLLKENNRVARQTQFNGQNLTDGSFGSAIFQVGANSAQTITVPTLTNATTTAMGRVPVATASGLANTNVDNGSGTITDSTGTGISDLSAVPAGSITIEDANGDAVDIGAIWPAKSITERMGQVVEAINNVSSPTGVSAYVETDNAGVQTIKLTSAHNITVSGTTGVADDGSKTGLVADTTAATAAESGALDALALDTFAGADLAIRQVDEAMKKVNSDRAAMGALQSRFESTVTNLETAKENLSSARSRIEDTDFAAETANLTRTQILQQAGTAMLTQANTTPQSVLSLLKG